MTITRIPSMLACVALLSLLQVSSTVRAEEDAAAMFQASYEHEARTELVAALQSIERVPHGERGTYLFRLRYGWLLYLNGRYAESIAAYKGAVQQAPGAIEPLLGLSLPQIALRQWSAVEATTQQVLRIDPLNTLALSRLAFAYYNLGRYPDAEARYRKVLELYPSDVDMQIGVGFCQLRRGDARAALATLTAVQRFAPKDPRVGDGLATAREKLGNR